MIKKICKFCKKELTNTKTNFCNMTCYNRYRKKQIITKTCDNCGKEYQIRKRNLKRNKHFFCGLNCMYEYKRKNDLREFSVNDDYFDVITSQNCWLLGLLASDGNITKDKFVKISQSGKEGLKCINYIKKEMQFTGTVFSYLPKIGSNEVHSLSINSRKLVNKLKNYNIIQNKTKIFKIPQVILNNEDFLRWFLIGYIDGDGCIGIYSNRGKENNKTSLVIEFVCNNLMSKQLKKILNKFKPLLVKKSNNLFEYRFNSRKGYNFGKWLYLNIENQNIYLSYKYKKFKYYEKNILKTLRWYKYNNLYKQLKYDIQNNSNFNKSEWKKKYKVGWTWLIKSSKIIKGEL